MGNEMNNWKKTSDEYDSSIEGKIVCSEGAIGDVRCGCCDIHDTEHPSCRMIISSEGLVDAMFTRQ